MILRSWVSRGFLRPSHHYLPCHKEEVLIEAPWGVVQAWREYSGRHGIEADVFFLRFLGSRGRAELATLDPADRLPGTRAEVWTVNPPAFGGTTGPPDLDRYADCANLAMKHLLSVARGRPVWACGKSIGTTAALLAAAQGAAGVILRNVVPLRPVLHEHYAWRTAGLSWLVASSQAIPSRLDGIANAAKATCPALFLVSRADRIVPPRFQQRIIAAYAGPVTVLEVAGGHDERALSLGDEDRYRQALGRLIAAA